METRIVYISFFYIAVASASEINIQPTIVPSNLVTQTVYGFLDFTTTIGNTVMIFSPQSTSIDESEFVPPSEVRVIENKPSKQITRGSTEIKPSKTEKSPEIEPSNHKEKIVTVVNVISQSASPSDKKISKPLLSSQVDIIEPSSIMNEVRAPKIISSIVEVVEVPPTKLTSNDVITKVEIVSGGAYTPMVDVISVGDIFSDVIEPSIILGNNIGDPEYEFLSRQPSEVIEETYKVINFRPTSSKFILKPRQSANTKNKAAKKTNKVHPTGLVTKLEGTVVKDGQTTVHETSVIGTYISGKYAQVLQSSSHIVGFSKGKIRPSPTLKILKTAAPSFHKSNKNRHLDPTPAASINQETAVDFGNHNKIKSSKRAGQQFKLRYRNKQNESTEQKKETNEAIIQQPNKKKSANVSNSRNSKQHTSHRPNKLGRSDRKKSTTTSSVFSRNEPTTAPTDTTKKYQSSGRRNKQHRSGSSESANTTGGFSRRTFKPKVQTSSVEVSASPSLFKLKLNRSPGRWQYKTTPKPRVIIRKQIDNPAEEHGYKNSTSASVPVSSHTNDFVTSSNEVSTPQSNLHDDTNKLEEYESVTPVMQEDDFSLKNKVDTPLSVLETIKVEISTPPDFKDIYFEIATIKSPYTFKVGSVKNTRFITVTSTFERSLKNTDEATKPSSISAPLTENILATSSNYGKDNNFLDSSIATLPPIYLASDIETPPLETLTETFSTTETLLKTHLLPIIRNPNDTSMTTLVQTYLVTRLVTATKTLPPMDAYQFIPSKTLNEFNSRLDEAGSELHLELEFGDDNEQDEAFPKRLFPPDLDLANIGSRFHLSDVDKSNIEENHLRLKKTHKTTTKNQILSDQVPTANLSPEQLQQLAILRLFNPAIAAQPQVITTSRPVLKIETVYESHVIPITNGPNTFSTTLSKVIGTVTKTEFEYGSSTLAPAFNQPLPFPQAPVNPIFPQLPQAQPQFSLTSSPVVQTTSVTQITNKVLKLTFGAKTAYTTVISSIVVPTVLTTFVTTSVPVQQTATFPGYFPAPFPPYPYVG